MGIALDAVSTPHACLGAFSDLSIRFLKRGPDEQLVEHIRSCASKLTRDGRLEVTIEPHRYGTRVQLQGAAWPYPIREADADPNIAVERAFARAAATLDAEAAFSPVDSANEASDARPGA